MLTALKGRLTNETLTHTHHHPGPGSNAHTEAECRAAVSNRFGFKWRCLTAGGVHVACVNGGFCAAKRRKSCPVEGRQARNVFDALVIRYSISIPVPSLDKPDGPLLMRDRQSPVGRSTTELPESRFCFPPWLLAHGQMPENKISPAKPAR